MSTPGKRAVVLLSGGLDSTTSLAVATRRDGFEAHALCIAYGQRHAVEIRAAERAAQALRAASFRVVSLDLRTVGGSALTSELDVPRDRSAADLASGVPVTYVPARNTVFLSLALGLAEVVDAADIFTGVNAVDYSGYPDCRPAFIDAFQALCNVATAAATERGVRYTLHSPLMRLHKADIIRLGLSLGVDYAATHSCYDPVGDAGLACGRCDSCSIRRAGFASAGVPDPTRYA
jgi:7-cyano-7-deazaguanine synthase